MVTDGSRTRVVHAGSWTSTGPFAITEINSQLKPGRPAWFADAWQWAQDNDCLTFAIYYDAPGSGTPYEWDPSDTDTINTLSDINSAAAA